MISEEKKNLAADILRQKASEIGRTPKKDDFDDTTVARIKAYLGPWPRALEYAGLKEAKEKPVQTKKRKSGKAKAQRLTGLKSLQKKRNKENANKQGE